MAGMPKMQEHFSAIARDGGNAENAGAFFGYRQGRRVRRKCRMQFSARASTDTFPKNEMYAENAGAFFGAP